MLTKSFVIAAVAALSLVALPFGSTWAETTDAHKKVKVLYHVDGKDHGPALELFEKDKMDPEMAKRFQQVVDKGVHAEMCQVSMKLYNKTLDNLAKGFVATLHPVAVKRIADLQQQGYLYIKP